MSIFCSSKFRLAVGLVALALIIAGCTASASNQQFFGRAVPPRDNTLHYVSGSEPESLDPQIGTGQPEARIYMALFEGLTEYDPKTMAPIPAIAESWDVNHDSSEFIFHLRKNARWSNGEAITARDFVWSLRRGLSPELAARNAYLAYYVKYAQGYNEGGAFVRNKRTGEFLLAKDFKEDAAGKPEEAHTEPEPMANKNADPAAAAQMPKAAETEFHNFIKAPERLVVPAEEKARTKALAADEKIKKAVDAMGGDAEFVAVKKEDVGIEAVDDFTLRITLTQSAPFFLGLTPHQFFRAVPQKTVEQFDKEWTSPEHIVTCGPFKVETWKPYDKLVVVRDPMYWDAANVKLDRIAFYPGDDNPTIMNMYKAGQVDAVLNHTVPAAWLDVVRPMKDYMDAPEVAIDYYQINCKKPPMNDVRVRKAFNMSIDKEALARWRKIVKPLTAFSPEGIFPGYPQPKGDGFDPAKAKQLLAEAGFKDASGNFDPKKFPVDEVGIVYNTQESNRIVAEFIQAQWKQNLGLTVPLKNMEWKTFLDMRSKVEYKGFARSGWVGDYMDPFTFLNLFYTPAGDNGTGWWDPKYVALLDDANKELDPQKRYEKLAKAEAYLIDAQPVIPLYTAATNWVKKPYVKGMYPNPQTLHAWKFVYIENDPAKWDYGVPDMKE
ncbi:MAG: peptide ABC transporter substrate-binding protein [Acidobacteria bacterium]|nr:peptide ABC transporter substrate-binding protein [Acidobacteriota bacterium]